MPVAPAVRARGGFQIVGIFRGRLWGWSWMMTRMPVAARDGKERPGEYRQRNQEQSAKNNQSFRNTGTSGYQFVNRIVLVYTGQ